MTIDHETKNWVAGPADEQAAKAGCRFDLERGQFVVDWIERYCRLYQGSQWAGKPMKLLPWAEDAVRRLFGWVVWSDHWDREIRRFKQASIWVSKKAGKALAIGTPIPTPDGWTTAGALETGDLVLNEFGQPCSVALAHPFIEAKGFELEFSNGEKIVCNGEHLWRTTTVRHDGCRAWADDWISETFHLVCSLRLEDGSFAHRLYSENTPGPQLVGAIPTPALLMRCITVDNPSGLFLCGKSRIVTHNSPTLAALGLFLLAGDGEQGQQVYFAAKDGKHAKKVVGEHIAKMVEQSEDFREKRNRYDERADACRISGVTGRISYQKTNSYLEPLSSSNISSQKASEGLNGSLLVDEAHVVDWPFMRRLSRMGISRMNPLHIEVSTAGNDPDSYGRDRFNYALEVQNGIRIDQELFVAIHAAPQQLTDAELEEDPLKYGKMANPSLGITVDPKEYLSDYQKSKRSIQDFLDFKMYRLNIWQKGSNPWLRSGDIEKCQAQFTEDDLLGQECWAGLDLSRKRDMSALVLVFKGKTEEEYFLLPYFWLPRGRADELQSDVPILQWERSGHIEITPGPVTDYGFIQAKFRELAGKFDIQELAYDPHYGEETTQMMAEGLTDDKGNQIVQGTGVNRFVFAQNDTNFAAPTDDFERLTIAGKLHHNGHPVLVWQMGHAQVMKKVSKVNRVVKENQNSFRSVDGVIASVMALARATQAVSDFWYTYGSLRD